MEVFGDLSDLATCHSSLVTLFADRSELQAGTEKVPDTGVAAINGTTDELDLLLTGADGISI